jgi:hypothetical protein
VDLSSRLTRSSTFDLSAFEPSLGYMLARRLAPQRLRPALNFRWVFPPPFHMR